MNYDVKCPLCTEDLGQIAAEDLEVGKSFTCSSCYSQFVLDSENQHKLQEALGVEEE